MGHFTSAPKWEGDHQCMLDQRHTQIVTFSMAPYKPWNTSIKKYYFRVNREKLFQSEFRSVGPF